MYRFETFKCIEEYPEYQISDFGRVLHVMHLVIKRDGHGCEIVDAFVDGKAKRMGVKTLLRTLFTEDDLKANIEIWKFVVATNRFIYEFSNKKGWRRTSFVVPWKSGDKYMYVDIKGRSLKVHRLVAKAFLPEPKSEQVEVNHKDHDTTNNDVTNLEWCTVSYNRSYRDKSKCHSQYYGVNRNRKKWEAMIVWQDQNGNGQRWRGTFMTEEEAAKARDKKLDELGLDHARNNV